MSFEDIKAVWKNGEFIAWEDATVHLSAHALHYGSGVFEGIRAYATDEATVIFRLHEHFERLIESAAVYDIKIPYFIDELEEATRELIRKNEFAACYIRPIVFMGSGTLGVHPGKCPVEVSIMAWEWAAYLGAEGLENGIRVTVSPWRKFHSSMMPTTAKACGQYLNSILAVQDAFARGYDEALLLDINGNLAEGSGENLFIVKDGKLVTNNADDSILLGITRNSVIRIAEDLGIERVVRSLSLNDLLEADEAFFTGTAAEVTPIRELDEKIIGDGKPGETTRAIQKKFFEIVNGKDANYAAWLDVVENTKSTAV
ncbi:MAG: branched-chain amino acid transaminase [Pyrinomonadaceae bacterium]